MVRERFTVSDEMMQIVEATNESEDKETIREMFNTTDTDGDGRITFLEFVRIMQE